MKRFFILVLCVFATLCVFSQNFNLNATTTVNLNCASGGVLYDSGGAAASYPANQNFAYTICTNGNPLSAQVVSVLMGTGDFLAVFDGTNTITSPLLFVFDANNSLASGAQLRASATNLSGCLTFQMSSDAALEGNFQFTLSCLPACQNITADVLSSSPAIGVNDTNYIDLCPKDTLIITGTGIYTQNNITYAQSDATSIFYWDFGILGKDTGQTIILPIPIPKIYSFTMIVMDVNGCRSINELPYTIRKAPQPELSTIIADSTLCLNQSTLMYSQIFSQSIDSFVTGDTIRLQSSVSVTDTVFLPDDSDNISGNGITTPIIYNLPISGYQPGAQMTLTSDLIEICLDIEHSWVGDLDIILVCPSGQSIALIDFSPPGTPGNDLGIPGVGTAAGTPFTYCWSPTATLGSIAVGQPAIANTPITAGTYSPVGNWNSLIGCPLNGNWSIQIFDDYGGDDGWTFGASASFNPAKLASNDSLVIRYENPLWQPNSNITTFLGNDSIQITLTDTAQTTFYFSVEDNLGCIFYDTATIYPDVYEVVASPDSTLICGGESVQLIAEITPNDNITCATSYNVYAIPYYKETGITTPIIFTQPVNGTSQILTLPFTFPLFCVNQTQARLTTNGYLQFGASTISLANNLTMPVNILPNNIIALMWDDLTDTLSTSSYFTTGTAPNRKFVINVDLKHVGGTVATEQVLGQIILHETQNYFDLICENCQKDLSDPTATQGAENFTGFFGSATPGRNNANWSATNSAYRYYPQTSLNTYTTSWTPASSLSGANTTSPMATPTATTNYIVNITSPNLCTYSDTILVQVGGSFAHGISPDTAICLGESVQLTATGGAITVAWTPNNGSISDTTIFNPIFTPTTTTTYTAALDSFSCLTYEYVTVFVSNINVDSTVVNTETCAGSGDASIQIFTSSGLSPQYSINGGASFDSTNLFQSLNAGIYDIVVNENGLCDTAYQVTIIGGAPLDFDSIVVSNALCGSSNNGMIQIYVTSGIPPLMYSINNGVTSQSGATFSNLVGGTYQVHVQDSFNCILDSTVVLAQPSLLVLSLVQVDSANCFNTNDGEIQVNASGGTPGFTYSIDGVNFVAGSTFSNLEDSTYTIYVEDANLCLDSVTTTVFSPLALNLVMSSANVTCKGLNNGNATITVTGGSTPYFYLWNDPLAQSTNVASTLAAGTYQVLVSDANSCSDTVSVAITEPDSLLMTIDNVVNVQCNGAATGLIAISTAGGTIPYSYLWTNGGGTNEDLSNVVAGNYTLTVTDSKGCTFQITQAITQDPALVLGLVGTNVACFGGSTGAIDATVNGGFPSYVYAWTGPNGFTATTQDLTALAAGAYTLVTTDANNCTKTQTYTVTQPATVVINVSITNVNCFGGNSGSLTANVQSGGVAPFQYQWGAAANNQVGATASGLVVGTYTVTVTDANGCTFTSTSTLAEPLSPLTVVASGTAVSCATVSDGIALANVQGGTPGYVYLWNDLQGQTTNPASALVSNVYQVTVTDANGCTASDTAFIDAPTPMVVAANPDSANCWGDASGAINVFASGGTGIGYAYSIDGGVNFQNSPDFLNLSAGVYDEIVVQDLGSSSICLSNVISTIVFEQPYFTFEITPEDTTLQLEESVALSLVVTSPNYTNSSIVLVSWSPTFGLNCNDCIDPTVLTYEHYTEYTATVSYLGGDGELCTANSNTIVVVENNVQLFIPNAFTPGSFDDMNNVFEIFGEGIEYVTMQIFNRWGEKIFESSNQKVSWDGTFKGEMQKPGVYTFYVDVEYLDGKVINRKGSVTLIR